MEYNQVIQLGRERVNMRMKSDDPTLDFSRITLDFSLVPDDQAESESQEQKDKDYCRCRVGFGAFPVE